MKRFFIRSIIIALLFFVGMIGCNKKDVPSNAEDIQSILYF